MFPVLARALCLSLSILPLAAYAGTSSLPSPAELSQTDGAKALQWVRAQNAHTEATLASDPRYRPLYQKILTAEQSPTRLAVPHQQGGEIWNFWQDDVHIRGIWRSASTTSFSFGHPDWKTRFDLDALARSEHENWVMEGLDCLVPEERFCLMALSRAGEDAHVVREYDTQKGAFVKDGFVLPSGKQTVTWVDANTLLVSRDWGAGDAGLTKSGYPYSVRLLRREQSLAQATEVYRGQISDMDVSPETLRDEKGHQLFLISRHRDFFHTELSIFSPKTHQLTRLPLPEKYDSLSYLNGQLVFHLLQDWVLPSQTFHADSIVALDLKRSAAPELILSPTSRQTIGDGMGDALAVTKDGLVVVLYDNVQPVLKLFRHEAKNGWTSHSIALPRNMAAEIVSSDPNLSKAYLQLEGFTQPPQLWGLDTASQTTKLLYRQPDLFDASGLVVEQMSATSPDGTAIPYFIVHAKGWQKDGARPTLMTAYGGFGLSYLPVYHPDLGITWFDRGGVYVMANIRGGGEFGPAWHEVARREGRQKAYDDFAAVARDLTARHITSPKHLGLRGRSNGGLLAGVEFTQHPDLWNAVIIGVPLLDMMNYEQMAAGASWAAEYGSTSEPGPRAFWEKMSPLQNLKAGVSYPEPFIFTSTRDDRVGPIHARRFAARLESLKLPFLYYEDVEGGHAGTVNAAEVAHERALEAIYLSRKLMDAP
ncbi:prolyl oligopeptidase family serine peptidase [Gluconobacter roseus]|uniref:Peptidase y4nA n=1 Tax=Gluconobacter roseus NBRC 3990 TaxID=1307950 RepID=A0A4Y3MBW6_9PROT|nr:prolyl oligopeptidase family serine peptidase [Gluconobacter roseus]KXV43165.1 prolyl oligopeptidase [Gluconobacter roseus]GBR43035.1 prolyl oligopeptidase [Gluconobacter roseus NBRC 3990]GEB03819.1 putative peptidase y4nA [Gluconobacter roseus NBRC 3990]GLP94273.1 putative peptidase y4nA [Gluconobacter roseus NBRC 3990]